MRIVNSQVTSQSVQQQSTERLQLQREQIRALSREDTQQRLGNGSDSTAADQGSQLLGGQGSADREASVTLELTITHADRLALQAASVVTGPEGDISTHLSQSIIEAMTSTSRQAEFTISRSMTAGDSEPPVDATFIEINNVESVETQTSVQMNTQGSVTTADGRTISFLMQLDFDRLTTREQVNTFVGDVDLIDPLAINLNGESVQLRDEVFEFDLNADGELNILSKTASGSGYLVYDRNGNGKIDDGSELFGPSTGYGYQELAELDDDGNGWIDEGDAAFEKLGFWEFDDQGDSVFQSLSSVGLGAISLTSAATEYDLLNSQGELLAQVKNSGAALMEDGAVAVVQELNLRNFVTQTNPEFIDDDGQEDTRFNPLAFFQDSADERIQNRNEDTPVIIQGNDFLSHTPRAPLLQRGSVAETALTTVEFTAASIEHAEVTLDRQTQTFDAETQRQVVERMQAKLDFRTSVTASESYVWTPEAAENRSLNNLPTPWQFDQTPEDGVLERLKSLVDALKETQQHHKDSMEKLGMYHSIGRFN
ncbi:MAG: hypothetical protein WED11_02505 [Natronospirillum sp.]